MPLDIHNGDQYLIKKKHCWKGCWDVYQKVRIRLILHEPTDQSNMTKTEASDIKNLLM